ncbi:MAG: phosphatase PAP2 family protein [bacterium]|nr:phosphatase PAP2 family protein [bacterium]
MNFLSIVIAKYLIFLVIKIPVFYFLIQKRNTQKRMLVFMVLNLALIFIAAKILSLLYYDPRPFVINHFTPLIPHAADNGFPSDHALLSFAVSFSIYIFNKKLGLLLMLFGILIGISRIYVGIHSPVDILGSFLISFLVTALLYKIFYLKLIKLLAK